MDSISSATPECLESTRQAKHHNRSNFGRRLLRWSSFQAILFYSPELSHESTAKPWSVPQTLSAPEETMRPGRYTEEASELGKRDWGNSVVLGQFTWSWLLPLLPEAWLLGYSKSQPPFQTLQEKRRGSPDRSQRTLMKEHGCFYPLLEANWFWLRKSWLQPSQRQNRLEVKKKEKMASVLSVTSSFFFFFY